MRLSICQEFCCSRRHVVFGLLRDQHNSSHHTKAELNKLRLTSLDSQNFFKTLAYFSVRFQYINRCFFLADTPQKVDKINRAICFAYYCISSIQIQSEIQSFRLRIAVNAIFLVHCCPNSLVSNEIYHRILMVYRKIPR